jgi:hypothetical protein
VANQRNPAHANPPHQKGEGHRVTGPKQTWLEENQTRAVEFSRNNHTTRTSPENPQKDSRSLFRRRCVCVSALLCLHISSSPEHSPNRRLFENGLPPRDEEPATTP